MARGRVNGLIHDNGIEWFVINYSNESSGKHLNYQFVCADVSVYKNKIVPVPTWTDDS